MAFFGKTRATTDASEKKTLGRGVFRKCEACNVTLRAEEFTGNYEVCPECGHHYRLSGEAWVDLLIDPGTYEETDAGLVSGDPLRFNDSRPYPERVEQTRKKTGLDDAMSIGGGTLQGRPIQLGVFLFRFMGGSMGSVVGEKITRLFEHGAELGQPVVLLSSSGGARMQEGVLSLMQMAKTVGALRKLREANMPFISVLLNPTTGGVAASFALLGDVNIAEPRALIGFAGPRVIENTIRQKLPEGFQRSEFLLEHGMIDMIAERRELRSVIARALGHLLD
ncbi:MAG: acetyl-CoA carboxylase, carboxyltransferase subunit beta [Sandaracinaceae bacterium]|nr:acetyl-CoA carboxylase, carboxyltransferase subunit beta [Sandaracinaceae bacterium]